MRVYEWKSCESAQQESEGAEAKVRVAAYCRVSTDSSEQASSYKEQCLHYSGFIRANPQWEFAGIYADEGVSGLGTRRRSGFLRMLRDCEDGKINLIITKSISRFARNTVDTLVTIRRLSELRVGVIFEKENLNTLHCADEFLVTLWASFAQAESISISKNVQKSIHERFARGEGRNHGLRSIGYRKDAASGALVVCPEEADVVRFMYRSYLEGRSDAAIARQLEAAGVPSCSGGTVWYHTTVANILCNEINMGDLLLQKSYTADTLTHTVRENRGQRARYYVRHAHEPIVPAEIFFAALGERRHRALLRGTSLSNHARTEPLAGKLVCGACGRTMKRVTFPDGHREWQCSHRASTRKTSWRENSTTRKCSMRRVTDEMVMQAVTKGMRGLAGRVGELQAGYWQTRARFAEEKARVMAGMAGSCSFESPEGYEERVCAYAALAPLGKRLLQLRNLLVLAGCAEPAAEMTEVEAFLVQTDCCSLGLADAPAGAAAGAGGDVERYVSRITVWQTRMDVELHPGFTVS